MIKFWCSNFAYTLDNMPSGIGVKVMSVRVTVDTRKGLKQAKFPSLFSVVVDTSDHIGIEERRDRVLIFTRFGEGRNFLPLNDYSGKPHLLILCTCITDYGPQSFFPFFLSVVSLIKKQFQFLRELLHNLTFLTGQDEGDGGVTHEKHHNTTMLGKCVRDVDNDEIVIRPRRNYTVHGRKEKNRLESHERKPCMRIIIGTSLSQVGDDGVIISNR